MRTPRTCFSQKMLVARDDIGGMAFESSSDYGIIVWVSGNEGLFGDSANDKGVAPEVVQEVVQALRDLGVLVGDAGTLNDFSVFGEQEGAGNQAKLTTEGGMHNAGRGTGCHERATDQDIGVNHHAQRAGPPEPQPPPEPHQL